MCLARHPSHLPGRTAGRQRESGGQSEIPCIPATSPTPTPLLPEPPWRPHRVHQGNRRKSQKPQKALTAALHSTQLNMSLCLSLKNQYEPGQSTPAVEDHSRYHSHCSYIIHIQNGNLIKDKVKKIKKKLSSHFQTNFNFI